MWQGRNGFNFLGHSKINWQFFPLPGNIILSCLLNIFPNKERFDLSRWMPVSQCRCSVYRAPTVTSLIGMRKLSSVSLENIILEVCKCSLVTSPNYVKCTGLIWWDPTIWFMSRPSCRLFLKRNFVFPSDFVGTFRNLLATPRLWTSEPPTHHLKVLNKKLS